MLDMVLKCRSLAVTVNLGIVTFTRSFVQRSTSNDAMWKTARDVLFDLVDV